MSCNGCRVLRKGCGEKCSLRPCLRWINSPQSQANATLFLAKFYGRAGLINLINQGPVLFRPAIFKSLLYEACGRIINPINGSAGLVWDGRWELCKEAVEAVLKGMPIMRAYNNDGEAPAHPILPLKGSDIRHTSARSSRVRHRSRKGFKWSGLAELKAEPPAKFSITGWDFDPAPSHDSLFSVETVEPSLVNRNEPVQFCKTENRTAGVDGGLILKLTLGVNPV